MVDLNGKDVVDKDQDTEAVTIGKNLALFLAQNKVKGLSPVTTFEFVLDLNKGKDIEIREDEINSIKDAVESDCTPPFVAGQIIKELNSQVLKNNRNEN
jgi:hypothetical protein